MRDDAKVKIVRYLRSRQVDDGSVVRRQQLEGELTRVSKLFQWEHIAEDEYLAERRRITRSLDELPIAATTAAPDDAIAIAGRVGELWDEMTVDERRRFIDQWFDEVHIGRRAETLEFVPAVRTRELVYAAVESSPAGVGLPFIKRG